MTTAKKMNPEMIEELKNEVKHNPMVEYILLMLTLRERNMGTTNLYRFKLKMQSEGFKFSDEQYKAAWKKLQALGLGVVKYSRRSKFAAEFIWDYNMTETAQIAFEEAKILEFKKEHSDNAPIEAKDVVIEATAAKRKPGRPKGSKNKVTKIAKGKRGPGRPAKEESATPGLTRKEINVLKTLLQKMA